MSREDRQVALRIPTPLYEQVRNAAEHNHRSINGELKRRIEQSFGTPGVADDAADYLVPPDWARAAGDPLPPDSALGRVATLWHRLPGPLQELILRVAEASAGAVETAPAKRRRA